jgi:DNA-binding GntR family transcriptional regulator
MEGAGLEGTMKEAAQPEYNRLRDLIRADVIEGRLPSGSRLKIAELAARYSSSGIPVREALQQLQGEGVVIFTPNRGARVRQIDEQFIRNIHEVRAIVEPYLLRWFVRHHSPEQLAVLEAVQRDYDRAAAEGVFAHWTAQNRRFHGICYDGHYNTEALVMAARHSDLIRAIALRIPAIPARARQASREHWAIIEKVREQDEDGAAAVVAEHVRHAGQHMIERMLAVGWPEMRRPRPAAEVPSAVTTAGVASAASPAPVLTDG